MRELASLRSRLQSEFQELMLVRDEVTERLQDAGDEARLIAQIKELQGELQQANDHHREEVGDYANILFDILMRRYNFRKCLREKY